MQMLTRQQTNLSVQQSNLDLLQKNLDLLQKMQQQPIPSLQRTNPSLELALQQQRDMAQAQQWRLRALFVHFFSYIIALYTNFLIYLI